eukprot:SAG22_NODE_943_length_6400_cov_3.214093_2_plen_86_part_00
MRAPAGNQDLLLTVSLDNQHTINVWEWRKRDPEGNVRLLASAASSQGTPPQVRASAAAAAVGWRQRAAVRAVEAQGKAEKQKERQ